MGEQGDVATEPDQPRSSRRRKAAVGAAVVVIALIAGAGLLLDDDGGQADDRGGGTDPEITSGFRYASELRTAVGERATVVNDDDVPHSYTSDDGLFDTGVLDAGEEARLPSLAAGTYPYHCEIHPALRGELVVSG